MTLKKQSHEDQATVMQRVRHELLVRYLKAHPLIVVGEREGGVVLRVSQLLSSLGLTFEVACTSSDLISYKGSKSFDSILVCEPDWDLFFQLEDRIPAILVVGLETANWNAAYPSLEYWIKEDGRDSQRLLRVIVELLELRQPCLRQIESRDCDQDGESESE